MDTIQEIMNTSFNLEAETKPPQKIWDIKLQVEG